MGNTIMVILFKTSILVNFVNYMICRSVIKVGGIAVTSLAREKLKILLTLIFIDIIHLQAYNALKYSNTV